VTDLEMLRQAMLLNPYDDLGIEAYRDEWEALHGHRPACLTWVELEPAELVRNGKELFSTHPFREVRLKGRRPVSNAYQPGWDLSGMAFIELVAVAEITRRYQFPEEFSPFLRGHVGVANILGSARGVGYRYRTEAEAMASVSHAALNYGRMLANLPVCPAPRP
jgi:hypothetical protein